jgi:hypothetical protein
MKPSLNRVAFNLASENNNRITSCSLAISSEKNATGICESCLPCGMFTP